MGRRRDGDHRPLVVVLGNCQADVYRDHLAARPGLEVPRIRPVHEMDTADVEELHALLARADALVTQPVRDGYRGLAVGSRETARLLPAHAARVVVPVLRYAGLHPFQVVVRPPSDRSLVPPVVPYHDLRTLTRAAGLRPSAEPGPEAFRAAEKESVDALCLREQAHGALVVSDLLGPRPRWHTINHPDRETLDLVLGRITRALPFGDGPGLPVDREPLGSVRAPVADGVEEALGLPRLGRRSWLVDGREIDDAEVVEAHLDWYGRHPDAVTEGLRRHETRLRLLGWS